MPAYEFFCQKCRKVVTIFLTVSDYEKKKRKCPKCGSVRLERRISPIQVQTSRKS